MDLNSIYYNIDPDASYTIYDLDGQDGAVSSDQTPPEDSTVIASGISGETAQKDIRNEQQTLWNSTSQSKDYAQQQEAQVTQEYYSYLTDGESSE